MGEVYLDGSQARITCERCGIYFFMTENGYFKNVQRGSEWIYVCRDCRPIMKVEKK